MSVERTIPHPSNAPRRKPADIVNDIRDRLRKSHNFDDQKVLFGLAVELLRERQRQLDRRPRGRRWGRSGR